MSENTFRRVDWAGDQPLPSDDDDEYGMPIRPQRGPGLSDADLELLTLAAKVIGARAEAVDGEQWVVLHLLDGAPVFGWNPLRHSADAFELAVASNLGVNVLEWQVTVATPYGAQLIVEAFYDHAGDGSAATRRAVTRAVAEIGKGMA
jgi:hypothetical protein